MSAQAPELLESGACAVSSVPRHRAPRRVRGVLGWIGFAALVALLWPAQWGGLVGLTIVSGQSMEPTYHTGDLVVTVRQGSYQPGDVISYAVPAGQPGEGGHVIHRIVRVAEIDGERVHTTRGDNNPTDDQWAITGPDITGTALFHFPGVGRFLGASLLPIILAGALGGIVTVLLWPTTPEDPAIEHPTTEKDHGDG